MKYTITKTQLDDFVATMRLMCSGEADRKTLSFAEILVILESLKPVKPVKPLTDKQMMKRIGVENVTPLIRTIVRLVEAAHGIKR